MEKKEQEKQDGRTVAAEKDELKKEEWRGERMRKWRKRVQRKEDE